MAQQAQPGFLDLLAQVGFGRGVEAKERGFGGLGQGDVVFGEGADAAADDFGGDFVVSEASEGVGEGFQAAARIGFDDDRKDFLFGFADMSEEVFDHVRAGGGQGFVFLGVGALLGELFGFAFVFGDDAAAAGGGAAVEAHDLDGHAGGGFADGLAEAILHGFDPAVVAAGQEHLAEL